MQPAFHVYQVQITSAKPTGSPLRMQAKNDLQAAQAQLTADMATGAREREASDADWEQRLQQAIDSAEKWSAYANDLEKDKNSFQSQAGDLAAQLKVPFQA